MSVATLAPPEVPDSRKDWAVYADVLPNFWDREGVPSVSTILAWKYGGVPDVPAVWEAVDRGKKVHHAIQLWNEDDLDWESITGTDVEGYLAQWIEHTTGLTIVAAEQPLWAEVAGVRYVVRPDCVLGDHSGTGIVDIKTKSAKGRPPGQKEKEKHALEVAAQLVAVQQRGLANPSWRECLYLWPDKKLSVQYGEQRYIDQWTALVAEWAEAQEEW